ncbi:MAG TPA: hypothetical protein VFX97_06545 [Pyrinomonadaceae bacterium]|nr:hypothetical protein [Pyrinomonadaceae bacterium]
MKQSRRKQTQAAKPISKSAKGIVVEGLKKGEPIPVPAKAFPRRRGGPRLNCRNCRITSVNGQPVPAGKNNATAYITENTNTFDIRATRQPADCPCTWSNVNIEYVAIAIGTIATRLKRKDFKFDQILEVAQINPNRPNPYFTVNECTLTVKISQLNDDFRNGINTSGLFIKGVVTLIKVGVKCNSKIFTLYLNITDK